jgi:hypothetical protein
MNRIAVRSTIIASIGYDPALKILEVEFEQGGVYQYSYVPEKTYIAFMQAPSKGAFLEANIKGIYPYQRVG